MLIRILLAWLYLFIATGCTSLGDKVIAYPKGSEDLIRNIKFSVEHDLWLDEKFYDVKKLQYFFGTNEEVKIDNFWEEKGKYGFYYDTFRYKLMTRKNEIRKVPETDVDRIIDYANGGMSMRDNKLRVGVSIGARNSGLLKFSEVIKVLGTRWKKQILPAPPHGQPFDLVFYDFENEKFRRKINIYIRDGNVSSIDILIEEK